MALLLSGAIASGLMFAGYTALRLTAGYCPKQIPHQPDFDADRYTGRWYEFRRENDLWYEKGTCTSANYSFKPDGQIRVENTELRPADGSHYKPYYKTTLGTARVSEWNPGQLGVQFFIFSPFGDYNVVSTDYDSYVIVYSCAYMLPNALPSEALWVLTREPITIGTPEHDAIDLKTKKIIREILPHYDFKNSMLQL